MARVALQPEPIDEPEEEGEGAVLAETTQDASTDPDCACPLDDEALLTAVRNEMDRSVGFENDQELRTSRELALNYSKGVMPDVKSLPNRSTAVDTSVADGIETVLPDLMEIFTGGEDVAAFIPTKAEDEDGAKQETDYLSHVLFQDNPGFLNLYSGFKDALMLKVAIFNFWWEKDLKTSEEHFKGKNAVEVQFCAQDGDIKDLVPEPFVPAPAVPDPSLPPGTPPAQPDQTFSFTLVKTKDNSKAKYLAVAPDDFSVAPDTIRIADTSYCCMRSRPRVQDMIADGHEEDVVRSLEAYSGGNDTSIERARDTAGEHENTGGSGDDSSDDLRQVEIRTHYIRLLDAKKKLCIWQVTTDNGAKTLLDKQAVSRIPFAAGSPYLVAHRFFGISLADKLLEIQRIKTALRRAVLDSAYFALNQRYEVAKNGAGPNTISDLLRNEPGVPVRSDTGNTVRPLAAGGLGFDAYAALEYFSTDAEARTGIVRNAQGLNPDTLHDTAKGAMALLSAAQKRVRLIARILAETCVKELYLGMHAVLRENARAERIVKLSGKWVPVNPSTWGERDAMTIEVGLGASGRDVEIAALTQIATVMQSIVTEGGAQGPIVTSQNVFNAATDLAKKLGRKQPQRYFTDPATAQPQQPKPDPAVMKVQSDQQLAQQELDNKLKIAQFEAEKDKEVQVAKTQAQSAENVQKNQMEHERQQAKAESDERLAVLELQSKERIAIEVARINQEGKIAAAQTMGKNPDVAAAPLAFQESHETTTV